VEFENINNIEYELEKGILGSSRPKHSPPIFQQGKTHFILGCRSGESQALRWQTKKLKSA